MTIVTRYSQIQSVKLQKDCVSYSWPRGPGLRTYGPTVVPPHRWRWLKRWSSCNRCNEHKKVRWWSAARVGRFLPTRNGHRWIRGEGVSSLEVNLYVYKWMWNHKILLPPVATNIPYHPVVSCYLKTIRYFFWLGICIIWLCVLPI